MFWADPGVKADFLRTLQVPETAVQVSEEVSEAFPVAPEDAQEEPPIQFGTLAADDVKASEHFAIDHGEKDRSWGPATF